MGCVNLAHRPIADFFECDDSPSDMLKEKNLLNG
jgi:hypothetical protein